MVSRSFRSALASFVESQTKELEHLHFLEKINGLWVQENSNHKKFRRILFSWLLEIRAEWQLRESTLHIAFDYAERIRAVHFETNAIQLAGAAALGWAMRVNEPDRFNAVRTMLIDICDDQYSTEDFKMMQAHAANALGFRFQTTTPAHYLDYLYKRFGGLVPDRQRWCDAVFLATAFQIARPCVLAPRSIAAAAATVAAGIAHKDAADCLGDFHDDTRTAETWMRNKDNVTEFDEIRQFLAQQQPGCFPPRTESPISEHRLPT